MVRMGVVIHAWRETDRMVEVEEFLCSRLRNEGWVVESIEVTAPNFAEEEREHKRFDFLARRVGAAGLYRMWRCTKTVLELVEFSEEEFIERVTSPNYPPFRGRNLYQKLHSVPMKELLEIANS